MWLSLPTTTQSGFETGHGEKKKFDGNVASQSASAAERCLQRGEMRLQMLQRLAIVFRQFLVDDMNRTRVRVQLSRLPYATQLEETLGKGDLRVGVSRALRRIIKISAQIKRSLQERQRIIGVSEFEFSLTRQQTCLHFPARLILREGAIADERQYLIRSENREFAVTLRQVKFGADDDRLDAGTRLLLRLGFAGTVGEQSGGCLADSAQSRQHPGVQRYVRVLIDREKLARLLVGLDCLGEQGFRLGVAAGFVHDARARLPELGIEFRGRIESRPDSQYPLQFIPSALNAPKIDQRAPVAHDGTGWPRRGGSNTRHFVDFPKLTLKHGQAVLDPARVDQEVCQRAFGLEFLHDDVAGALGSDAGGIAKISFSD